MRHLILLLVCCALAAPACAAADTLPLSGTWQFFFARDAATADSVCACGFSSATFAAAGFGDTPVPSCWAVLGYEEPVYRGFKGSAAEGLYLRRFTVPASYKDSRVELEFGGVWCSAEVWLNGRRLGRHDSGYTSFAFDATAALRPDTVNVLAVRVRQTFPGYQTDTYDDWTLGGIYRDVRLRAMPRQRWIEQVRALTALRDNYTAADITIKTMVADRHKTRTPGNYAATGTPYALRLALTKADGSPAAPAQTIAINGHPQQGRETAVTFRLNHPDLWNAETPHLYTLRVELLEGDSVAQRHEERIGIREISTAGGVLRVNGQPVKLRGVNRHDEHPDVGRAVGRKHWLEDLRLMKRAHINYIRACHYQHAREFVELCDSMGFYVGEEVSLGGAEELMLDPAFVAPVLLRTAETVERDLNRPSVIYWSVGNEDALTAMHLRAVRALHGLDPSRPCLLPWHAYDAPAEIDIIAPHYWTAQQYDMLCARARRPVITTEYVHAYGTGRFGGLADCWRAITRHPQGAGGAVWMWADQGLRTPVRKCGKTKGDLAPQDPYLRLQGEGWDGITDSYRQPTRDFREVQAVYAPVFPVADTLRIVPGEKAVAVAIRNDYDFLTLDGVALHYRLCVDGRTLDSGTAHVEAAPHATAPLRVSLARLPRLAEGQTAYVRINALRGADTLSARDVVLLAPVSRRPRCADITYSTDPATGLPAHIGVASHTIIDSLGPAIWHRLTDNDRVIRRRADTDRAPAFRPELLFCETTHHGDTTLTVARVRYTADARHAVEAEYRTTATSAGLTIGYALTPHTAADMVPCVGLAATLAPGARAAAWFGLGPDDAYPNKCAAERLGLWPANGFAGTRAATWLDIEAGGKRVRVEVNGYVERDQPDTRTLRLLHHVLGRAEKGRLDDARFRLRQGQTYTGEVRIR